MIHGQEKYLLFVMRKVSWLDVGNVINPVEPGLWRSKIFQTPDVKNLAAMRVYFREDV